MTEISEAAHRLKELREQSGLTMREVAKALGWSLTRYQHYEDRYKRRFLPLDLARSLDGLFARQGAASGAVLVLAGIGPGMAAPPPCAPQPPRQPALLKSGGRRDLPVMGAVKGGGEGFYFTAGKPAEYVERPPSLQGVVNGFALYAHGDSMQPRYFAGEILYVNPNRPLSRDCFVAVALDDGQGLIKQFVQRAAGEIVLRQLNPPRDLVLKPREVKSIARITGASENG